MPLVIYWGLAAVMSGYGIKLVGEGVENASGGVGDLLIAGAVVGGGFLLAKNRGLI